jgi:hypothetical protein
MAMTLGDGIGGMSNEQLLLLVALGAMIFVVLNWRRNSVRRKNQRAETSVIPGNPLSVREVTTEVEALLGELEETSRRLAAQLDNRYTKLEQLLAEADERIRRLEELGAGEPETAPEQPLAGVGISGKQRTTKVAEMQTAVSEAQRTLFHLREERGAPPATEDPAYAPIYELADRGKTSREIAQELGRQPGEIELILALRQRG